MRKFITYMGGVLSENGQFSYKRFAALWFMGLFTWEIITNGIGKQRVLDTTLQTQLFELVVISLGAVGVVNIFDMFKQVKLKQVDANASVGSPTPPPETTIVAPEKPVA
jgi:hypothetical protein